MKILVLGDIVGKPGRQAVKHFIKNFLQVNEIDLIIANGENAAGGNGITKDTAVELFNSGINVLTMGNHVWDKKEAIKLIDSEYRIVRPANYPPGTPGKGYTVVKTKTGDKVAVLNLSGRVFLSNLDCPFRLGEQLIKEIKQVTNKIIIDFHAEATSEKIAFAWFMDGKVSAIYGTHTHVPTNDFRILPKGTAYITDLGMSGPRDSVLGVKTELAIQKFITQMPVRFEVANGPVQVNGIILELMDDGKASKIEPVLVNYKYI
ncbi:TIGR00282 family metallophosphoesterase [Bacillota bacterium LX-D]|nr:TIGR00282 family metallophosphoesterase [Bacillota bacterium LX-D]